MTHPTDAELEAMAVRLDRKTPNMIEAHAQMEEAASMLRAMKGRVRVKPLEWRSIGRDRVAKTMIGEYVVSLDVFQVGGTAYLWVAGQVDGDDHHSEHKNMQAAKAAAQADYAARILAALDPAPDHAELEAENARLREANAALRAGNDVLLRAALNKGEG